MHPTEAALRVRARRAGQPGRSDVRPISRGGRAPRRNDAAGKTPKSAACPALDRRCRTVGTERQRHPRCHPAPPRPLAPALAGGRRRGPRDGAQSLDPEPPEAAPAAPRTATTPTRRRPNPARLPEGRFRPRAPSWWPRCTGADGVLLIRLSTARMRRSFAYGGDVARGGRRAHPNRQPPPGTAALQCREPSARSRCS